MSIWKKIQCEWWKLHDMPSLSIFCVKLCCWLLLMAGKFGKVAVALQCYECSSFPREPGSQDESLGPCPGWLKPAKYYGLSSLYGGCMTVKLANNGTVLAQNAVIYSQCLQYQQNVPASLKLEEMNHRCLITRVETCQRHSSFSWAIPLLLLTSFLRSFWGL